MTRIGPRMREIAEYVERYPGCTPLAAAESLSYHGVESRQFGYRAVHRAERAGLIELRPRIDKAGCSRCYPMER